MNNYIALIVLFCGPRFLYVKYTSQFSTSRILSLKSFFFAKFPQYINILQVHNL